MSKVVLNQSSVGKLSSILSQMIESKPVQLFAEPEVIEVFNSLIFGLKGRKTLSDEEFENMRAEAFEAANKRAKQRGETFKTIHSLDDESTADIVKEVLWRCCFEPVAEEQRNVPPLDRGGARPANS